MENFQTHFMNPYNLNSRKTKTNRSIKLMTMEVKILNKTLAN